MMTDSNYVFISYKSEEMNKAKEIHQFLESAGFKCWRAPESLHQRGTQDYGNDIFEAIRNSSCVLFVLSNRALCSDWVRKEVKYALEKCHKPLVPFVIDSIPPVKYDSDELMITLSLQKQILNEDLKNDFSTIIPYLKQWIHTNGEETVAQVMPLLKHDMTEDEFKLIESEVNFYEKRIDELSKIDYLEEGEEKENRPFDVYQQELISSVRIAACGLIRMFRAITEGVIERKKEEKDSILEKLYKLTFDFGKYYNQDVFDLVEPYAKIGSPWASFVLHVKYYNPDMGSSDNVQPMAFSLLSNAVKDANNPYAAILLGTCYQWGIGCDVSGTKARFWYEFAIGDDTEGKTAKCPTAYAYLGRLYQWPVFGIDKNDKLAEEYFKKGTAVGDAISFYRYGDFLQSTDMLDKALEQYINAYERGELRALADIIWLNKYCNCVGIKLTSKEKKYTSNDNRLLKLAAKAKIPQLISIQSDPVYNCFFGEKDDNTIISYATSGVVLKEPYCAATIAATLIDLANRCVTSFYENNKSQDQHEFGEFRQFIINQLSFDKNSESQYILKALEYSKDITLQEINSAIKAEGYRDRKPPKSPFWQKLVLSGVSKGPSDLEIFNFYISYKFLEAIKEYPVHNESQLSKANKIWSLLREIDYEKYDAEQIEKGNFSCLSKSGSISVFERFSLLIRRIESLVELVPSLKQKWLPILDEMNNKSKFQIKTMSQSKLNKDIIEIIQKLFDDILAINEPSLELKIGLNLRDSEYILSHPALSVALDFYRLSYMWGGDAHNLFAMASLFLINNARLQDINRNEGLIYYISSELENCVYRLQLCVVPLFLEVNLFGISVGKARVEPNFEAIGKADPAISAIIQGEEGSAIERFEVAIAMAKIYNDKHLCNSARCEQQWGVSSLYNPLRAAYWFNVARKLLQELKERDDYSSFEKDVFKRREKIIEEIAIELNELGNKGFVQKFDEKEKTQENLTEESNNSQKYHRVEVDQKWVEMVKKTAEKLDLTFYDTLRLDENENVWVDFALATDQSALLFVMLPGDCDFEVLPKAGFEWGRGIPEIISKVISLDFITVLEKANQQLLGEKDLDENTKVSIGIIASPETNKRIKATLESVDDKSSLLFFDYDNLEVQFKELFSSEDDKQK